MIGFKTVKTIKHPILEERLYEELGVSDEVLKCKKELIKGIQPQTANIMRINHYFVKSWEEYGLKKKRGHADFNVVRTDAEFTQADQNDIEEEDLMKDYARAIHKKIDKEKEI